MLVTLRGQRIKQVRKFVTGLKLIFFLFFFFTLGTAT